MRLSSAAYEALVRSLEHPIRCTLTDEQLAEDHGVRTRDVRKLRDRLHRDTVTADARRLLSELAALLGWETRLGHLLEAVLADAVALERQRQEVLDALLRANEAQLQATDGVHSVARRQSAPLGWRVQARLRACQVTPVLRGQDASSTVEVSGPATGATSSPSGLLRPPARSVLRAKKRHAVSASPVPGAPTSGHGTDRGSGA